MPYQDEEDLHIRIARQPNSAERWLRRLFVEDLNLKLLALGITFVLWFAVTGQKKPMSKRITGVQLSFVHADKLEIGNDPPTTVDVTVTGSSDKLSQVNPMDLQATVLVGDYTSGDRVIRLSRERVKMDNLPDGVQIQGFQPAVISVRLEPIVERPVNVEIKLEGKVAEGYEVFAVTANPSRVRVSGPESHVNGIEKAPTESISLDRKKDSFDLGQVAINIPDQKVNVIDNVVQVHVEIGVRTTQRTFNRNDLPILATGGEVVGPPLRSVTVSGPPSILDQLRVEDIQVVAQSDFNTEGKRLKLRLPAVAENIVKLNSVNPSKFWTAVNADPASHFHFSR